jgi:AraC-like DNA-binding protein
MAQAAVVPLAAELDVLGVRFRPGALGALVRENVRSLVGTTVAPADLRLALDLPLERLAATPSLRLRAARTLAALGPSLRAAADPDPAVALALDRWHRTRPGAALASVAVLARDVGLSERTLERRFAARVGYAPVEFRRLARFRRVLLLRAGGVRDWAQLALECGYADQPHLVRDFRAFAGVAPEAWAREQARVGFLQDGAVTLD